MVLYHGSQVEKFTPTFGLGKEQHDFGKGFYLTDSPTLAQEWSVCRPDAHDGWVHAFDLDTDGLKVFDFRSANPLAWVAELMKHRDADDSAAYHRRAAVFVQKYRVDVSDADVIVGWRADASYFYIVKAFVRGDVDVDCLPQLLKLGGFGVQYVVKSQAAYDRLKAISAKRMKVRFDVFHSAYDERDVSARRKMRELIDDPSFNRMGRLFFDLVKEEVR